MEISPGRSPGGNFGYPTALVEIWDGRRPAMARWKFGRAEDPEGVMWGWVMEKYTTGCLETPLCIRAISMGSPLDEYPHVL